MMRSFIFDTETTGLVKNSLVPLDQQPRIIELFGQIIDLDTGDKFDEIEFFCDPGVLIEPIITKITGIKQEQLTGQKPFAFYAPKVVDMISSCAAIVAHNLSYDMALVEADCRRSEVQVKFPKRRICTVEETEWIKGHRLNLNGLHEELFGQPFSGAHRARTDVEALTRCAVELRRRGDL